MKKLTGWTALWLIGMFIVTFIFELIGEDFNISDYTQMSILLALWEIILILRNKDKKEI